ncbi:MAG: YfhO family protein [Chloroflexi bacterium]|nr:YfhO family protein [Chloroflexota bacterium]
MKRLAGWWPAACLVGLTALFLAPLLFSNRVLAGLDVFTYVYPYRQAAAEALREGRIPLWNPYLFMGVPFLANSQAGVLYPVNLLLTPMDAPEAIKATIAIHLALAGLLAYLLGRCSFGLGRWAALATGITFGLSGFLGAQAEHANQLSTSAWLPLQLLLVDLSLPGRWGDGAARPTRAAWGARLGLSLTMGVAFLAGHTQAWYIGAAATAFYALLPAVAALPRPREAGRRALAAALLVSAAVGGGLALAAAQLLPTLELSSLSIRSGGLPYREAASFSLRPRLLLYTLLPSYGEDLSQVFATAAWTEYVGFVGLTAWALAALGVVGSRCCRAVTVGSALAATGLFLALGGYNPVYWLLYTVVPGFSWFRVPARWLLWFALGMALLAGAGLEAVGPDLAARLQRRLAAVRAWWRWGRRRAAALGVFLAVALTAFVALQHLPGPTTWAGWAAAALGAVGLLLLGASGWRGARASLVVLLALELFAGTRLLPTNWPTARTAYSSLRTAPAFLLAQGGAQRFLSLSDIRYDPGDLPEMQSRLGDALPPRGLYDYVVAAKQKEILAPNLPLLLGVRSVDGYDGGVLPLRRYVQFQRLFLPQGEILPDGRLREQVKSVPPVRLLRLVSAAYIITDKVQDVWVDGFYYDLEHTARLGTAQPSVSLPALPRFPTTEIGVISYLQGAAELGDGAPVAEVWAVDERGREQRWTLRAGQDTAEGQGAAAHRQARAVHGWRDQPDGHDYLTVLRLDQTTAPVQMGVRSLLTDGEFHLRGLSLLHRPTQTSEPLILSTGGRFRLAHSGDVKVYENLDPLPRAYAVGRTRVLPDDDQAVAAMAQPSFDPGQEVILAAGQPLDGPRAAGQVAVLQDEPERMLFEVAMEAPSYLVLADSWYPGWQATVDGQPARVERANLLFRAVAVPAGPHQVAMEYRPRSWAWGWRVSLGAAALAAVWGVALLWPRRQRQRQR